VCRLLLTLGNTPQQMYSSFRELAVHGLVPPGPEAGHLDGWGWAWWTRDNKPCHRKAPEDARNMACTQAIDELQRARPAVVLGHLRKASPGIERSMGNTHPFFRQGWAFAHNGTLFEPGRLKLRHADLEGDSDSERLFLFLLERIEVVPLVQRREALQSALEELDWTDWSALNFLLTDGRVAFASCRFRDPTMAYYYTLWVQRQEEYWAICSEPVWGGGWESLQNGALLEMIPPSEPGQEMAPAH
jgi:predicted glutamine amidotransferase